MPSSFQPWPHINKLHDAQRNAHGGVVRYRPKTKLHGTNAAIRVDSRKDGGAVVAQSRRRDLTPANDNFGFAAWVAAHGQKIRPWYCTDIVVYGEWYGLGVQTGVALAELDQRYFAVFAAVLDGGYLLTEPASLTEIIGGLPAYVLPWFCESVEFNFDEHDAQFLEHINAVVEGIDAECPWAREVHGVRGHGEGLVFFPQDDDQEPDVGTFSRLAWKAKGASHRSSGKLAAHMKPPPSEDLMEFVSSVVTEPRCKQALQELGLQRGERAQTSAFIGWICSDVHRECAEELTVSGLEWRVASKRVAREAARWFANLEAA